MRGSNHMPVIFLALSSFARAKLSLDPSLILSNNWQGNTMPSEKLL